MADKEERIFIFTTIKYTIKETNEDGVIVDGFIEPRDKAKMYTRKEITDIIARVAHLSLEAGSTYPEAAKDILDYLLGNKKYKLGKNYDE